MDTCKHLRWILAAGLTLSFIVASPVAEAAGELNIYSYRQSFLTKPFIENFEKETGTTVNIVFMKRGMLERLKAEGANSPADLVMIADIARLHALAEADLLQPVGSAVLDENIPAQYRAEDSIWFGLTTRARVIYASRDRVAPGEVRAYEDLADAKWHGRICTRSGYHTYQLGLLSSIVLHKGEAAAEQWLAGVKANLARKPQGNDRAQVKAIGEGVCDLALGNSYYYGKMITDPDQRAWADAVRIVFPNQNDRGTHVNISGAAVTKSSQNRDNAVRFLEYLSSEAAQRLYARQNFEYPVKKGVPWDPMVEAWGRFEPDVVSLYEVARLNAVAARIVDRVRYDE